MNQHMTAFSPPGPLRISLQAGTLRLRIARADLPVDQLLGFASRRSRKRGFVFVSKVLGKHYPVAPGRMEDIHARLANKLISWQRTNLGVPGPMVFIALAETATGLGQGVYEQFLHLSRRQDLLFLHTTRYRLNQPLAFPFEEGHSHATRHLLYWPADREARHLFQQARTVVLIDDEISTGQTLANLAHACRATMPALQTIHLVSLTDWSGPERQRQLRQRLEVPLAFHNLLAGAYTFAETSSFDPGSIPAVDGGEDCKEYCLPDPGPRLGVRQPAAWDFASWIEKANLRPDQRVLVLGTGEFAHLPFRFARTLERLGWDVAFQSTTRSPLLTGGELLSMLEFLDNYHDSIPNYLYNVAGRTYDRILICYETSPLPEEHRLPQMLGACPLYLEKRRGFTTEDTEYTENRTRGKEKDR
jgi:hypothetical protein